MSRTLRGRVSLIALGAIAVLLAVLVLASQLVLAHALDTQVDDTVRLRAQAASSTVQVSDGRITVRESRTDSALDASIWVYDGTKVVERPPRSGQLEPIADRLARGTARFADGPDSWRLYALPITSDHVRVGTLVAAISSESSEDAQHAALVGSIIVGVLLLAGAYPVLRRTASRALTPVAAMTRDAAEWSATDPSQRFGGGQRYVELAGLARTLDELLDRITAVVRHERHLAAELSHELRTPITNIGAEADLLLTDPHLSQPHRDAVTTIRRTADSMTEIIETLLTATRADLSHVRGVCPLAPLLDSFASPITSVRVEPDDLAVGLDADVVRRIIAPVVENARRYARTSITITGSRADSQVIVEIGNDGPPIDEKLLERVFEPGFSDPDSSHDGTGLGLALARRLARAADGGIEAVPCARGASFVIELPPG